MVERNEPIEPDAVARNPLVHGDIEAARLALLRTLEKRPTLSQRELAAILGVSVGKTHFLLRALLDRGLVKAQNFKRSQRKSAYAYILTPSGLSEKLRLTKAFLSRKEAEYQLLHQTILALREELSDHNKPLQQE